MPKQFIDPISEALKEAKTQIEIFQPGKLLYLNGQVGILSYSLEEFHLIIDDEFQDFEVRLYLEDELKQLCTCGAESWCQHRVAALYRAKEQLKEDFVNSKPPGYAYTREGMMLRVLGEREEKAKSAEFKIVVNDNIFGEHQLTSPSGQEYSITLHNFKRKKGYCSCPDYQFNKLGTCKHLMFTFDYLKRHEDEFPRKTHFFPFIDVFLDPENDYKISYFYPHQPDLFAKPLIDHYFKGQRVLNDEDIPDMLSFLEQAQQFKQFKIREEVLEKVEATYNEQALIELEETFDFEEQFKTWYPENNLLKYQLEGAKFATFREAAIIADDMGLGKTKQAIAAALMKKQLLNLKRCLVICPVSLKTQWEKEIRVFGKHLCETAEGSPEERLVLYSEFSKYFLIASYETVLRDFEPINALKFDMVMLDEAQRIKDYESKTATIIKRLHRKHALVITGTPVENRLIDLYSIVDFLDKHLLAPLWDFSYRYCYFESHESNKITGYHNLDELRQRLAHILIRREKKDVMKELPHVRELDVPVVLHKEQYRMQRALALEVEEIVAKNIVTRFDKQKVFQLVNKMRMLTDSTYFLDSSISLSAKLEELEHILLDKLNLLKADHKVIVFTEWRRMANLIAFALRSKGLKVLELNGDVPSAKRSELFTQFETDPERKVFITTTGGSKGLNLQVADTLINVEVPQTSNEKAMRTGRVNRLGQANKKMSVFNLMADNSLDAFLERSVNERNNLFDSLLSDQGDDTHALFASDTFLEGLKVEVDKLLAYEIDEEAKPESNELQVGMEGAVDFLKVFYKHYSGKDLPVEPKIELKEGEELVIRFPLR